VKFRSDSEKFKVIGDLFSSLKEQNRSLEKEVNAMNNDWDNYDAAPIETFHSEAMEQFHRGTRFPANETFVSDIRYINGIGVNDILADFKIKIMNHYGISSSPTPKLKPLK